MRIIHSLLAFILIVSMSLPVYASDTPSGGGTYVTISVYYYIEGESDYFDVGRYTFEVGKGYSIQVPEKFGYEPDKPAITGVAPPVNTDFIVTYYKTFNQGDFAVTKEDLSPFLQTLTSTVKAVFPVTIILTGIILILWLIVRLIRNAFKG